MEKTQIAMLARKVFDDRTAGWLLNGDACEFTLNDLSLLVDAVLAAAVPAAEPIYCGCGDQIMPDDGARCGTCVAMKYAPVAAASKGATT